MKKVISALTLTGILVSLTGLPAHATASTNNDAQLSNGSAFVRSSWVEAGLKDNGTFGTTEPVPSNFDSLFDSQNGGLGLINDAGEDGFTSDDNGDFFMPGTPYEGWGIKVDDDPTAKNTHENTAISGTWTDAETTGDASVTWVADAPSSNILVTQNISAPADGSHLFHVTVTLENTDSASHVVFYSRQVDPDNNKDTGGDYSTFNRIISNSASSQIVTGTAYGPFTTIGYRSTDSTGAVRISDWSWPLGDDATTGAETQALYDSIRSDYKVGYQDYTDSTIDIVFRKEIAGGATSTVEFDYILDPREADVPNLALDLSLNLEVGADYANAETALAGGGLKPNSEYTLTEHSTPRVIFTGTTLPNGNFYDETALPADCRPGSHTLVLTGTSPAGVSVSDYVTYTVDDNCVVTAFNPYAGAAGSWTEAELADTGAGLGSWLTASGLIAAAGALTTVMARRRRIN